MSRSSFLRADVLLIAILCLSLLVSTQAQELRLDHRKARVQIINRSGRTIEPGSIFVSHKYSDVYKNMLAFKEGLNDGEIDNAGGKNIVDYNTGFLTTGRDWWYITWVFADTKAIYQSDPNNFQCALDILEGAGPAALSAAASAIAGVAACGFPPIVGCIASPYVGAGAAVAAGAIAKALVNNEKTCGFKRYILRTDDALTNEGWVRITIGNGNAILFDSPSGDASTKYEEIEIRPDGRIDIDSLKMKYSASKRVPDVAENDEGVNVREGIPERIEYARDEILNINSYVV